MKKLFILSILVLTAVQAQAGILDGKTFCRTVKTDGFFGQPRGSRQHCVSFAKDMMTDNANTFFGNPPETLDYSYVNSEVRVSHNGKVQVAYLVDKSLTKLRSSSGAVLDLQ